MPTKSAQKRFDSMRDLSTPRERKWLDRFGRIRFGSGRYKITSRCGPGDGQFRWLTVLGPRFIGSMPASLDWIVAEVRREEARNRRERDRRAVLETGAYI